MILITRVLISYIFISITVTTGVKIITGNADGNVDLEATSAIDPKMHKTSSLIESKRTGKICLLTIQNCQNS